MCVCVCVCVSVYANACTYVCVHPKPKGINNKWHDLELVIIFYCFSVPVHDIDGKNRALCK